LIDGLVGVMNTEEDVLGPINLGNPDEFSMKELAELVNEVTESSSRIINLELPADDPKQRKPDISRAKSLINWHPSVSLRQGLIKTLEDMRSRMSEN